MTVEFAKWNKTECKVEEVDFTSCRIIEWLDFSVDTVNKMEALTFHWINTTRFTGAKSLIYKHITRSNLSNLKATSIVIGRDGKAYVPNNNNISCPAIDFSDIKEKDNQNSAVYSVLNKIKLRDNTYFPASNSCKIVVIDHAENIQHSQEIYNLIKKIQESINNYHGKYIVILLNTKEEFDISGGFWEKCIRKKPAGMDFLDRQDDVNKKNEPYNTHEIEMIITQCNFDEAKKKSFIKEINNLPKDLYRAYYLDRFLLYLQTNPFPKNIKAFSVLIELYEEQLNSINETEFKAFQKSIKDNGVFGQDYSHTVNQNFICSYYIKRQWGNINDSNLMDLLLSNGIYKKREDAAQILRDAFLFLPSASRPEFFEKFVHNSKFTAALVGEIASKYSKEIDKSVLENIFMLLCDLYNEKVELCDCFNSCKGADIEKCKGEFKLRFEIGKILGELLIRKNDSGEYFIPRALIKKKLNCFFDEVTENYVIPQVNKHGISVNPITNFEYELFQRDSSNYAKIEGLPSTNEAREKYYNIFSEIFNFIKQASIQKIENQAVRRKLAKILKGVGWLHYTSLVEIINMISTEDSGKYIHLIKVLEKYYPDNICSPVKWSIPYKSSDIFCNPMQPVVGLSLFEAKAYALWLSDKIQKKVRIMKYCPDFVNIVGCEKNVVIKEVSALQAQEIKKKYEKQRADFLRHFSQGDEQFIDSRYFNCRTYYKCFYGMNTSSEPMTIGLIPNNEIFGLYDFCGNVFEMQDDHFNGYGAEDGCHIGEKSEGDKIHEWAKMFNCSGGGWQHSELAFPPQYMGQFTGFTRNQDIGFRVVIDQEPSKYTIKNSKKDDIGKSESPDDWESPARCNIFRENPKQKFDDSTIDLSIIKVTNPPQESVKKELKRLSEVVIYENDELEQLCFFGIDQVPQIAILVRGYELFAYELIQKSYGLSSDNEDLQNMCVSRKKLKQGEKSKPERKRSNREVADEIQTIIWKKQKEQSVYTAIRLDITSGLFRVDKRKGTDDSIIGFPWYIQYRNKKIFEKIKYLLSDKWFMPAWVDLFALSELKASNSSDKSDEYIVDTNDTNRIMTTLSIIDTVDMHMSIYEIKKSRNKHSKGKQ
ncbi:MAG: SUMF1/EgtB/PvdO family nonheme iron enzyme [Bacteroidales bacterium]|jgi:formylglycine-generating enzyme required for sulfatase activity|nr:SUMF1/EgtB/PvdO family nonheme iron enzyme [Bacteroidales bacterium]